MGQPLLSAGSPRVVEQTSQSTLRPLLAPSSFIEQDGDTLKPPPQAFIRELLSQRSNASLASSTATLMLEKRICHLPAKRYGRIWRNLRYTLGSVYRRLFGLVSLANIIAFVCLIIQYKNIFNIPLRTLSTATSANIFAAILMRQELTINLLFTVFGWCPQWVPLRIRRLFAKVYHFGGIHSGCGISATIWFTLFHISLVRSAVVGLSHLREQPAAIVLTSLIDSLLIMIVVTAIPRIRMLFHDLFERVHRFAGWSVVGLFWAQLIVLSEMERKAMSPPPSLRSMLIANPSFWLLIIISVFIISPWLQLRQVDVHPEFLSDHAIRLHFTYTNLALCCAPRFTDRPLHEWHAFAGIPTRGGKGYSIVVSNAGDWTKRVIRDPPSHLWTRGFPTKGVLNIAQIFKSVVLVATGSGIGPVLSLITARNIPCRIVWSTPTPETTYQQSIVDDVYRADPDAIIVDTNRSGRPDLVRLSYEVYTASKAEAVFIISNPKVTRKVVYGLESRGIPIFAPIFDS